MQILPWKYKNCKYFLIFFDAVKIIFLVEWNINRKSRRTFKIEGVEIINNKYSNELGQKEHKLIFMHEIIEITKKYKFF